MKKIALAILSLNMLFSCMQKSGSGNIITQTKTVGPFTGVNVSNSFEVEIRNGTSENVVVEADDNLVKYIDIKVVDGELKIRLDEINVSNAHLKVFVTAPHINNIKASAAAAVTVKDGLKAEGAIELTASSAASIKSALDAPEIKAEASSGAELTLSGRTKDLHATSSSGASVTAGELLSENSYINASSGGSAHVYASVSIDANASSGGNISYRGAAPSVKKSESSGGEVKRDN